MPKIELLDDGRLRLLSGKVLRPNPTVVDIHIFSDCYDITCRDRPQLWSVALRDGYHNRIRHILYRRGDSVAAIEQSGLALRVPNNVVQFQRPIFAALEAGDRYLVVLQNPEDGPNPVLCFDASGVELWRCPGYFRDIAPTISTVSTSALERDVTYTIDMATGAKSNGTMSK